MSLGRLGRAQHPHGVSALSAITSMQPKLMWTHVQSFVCGGHGRGAGKGGREGRESEEGREDEGREGEEVGGGGRGSNGGKLKRHLHTHTVQAHIITCASTCTSRARSHARKPTLARIRGPGAREHQPSKPQTNLRHRVSPARPSGLRAAATAPRPAAAERAAPLLSSRAPDAAASAPAGAQCSGRPAHCRCAAAPHGSRGSTRSPRVAPPRACWRCGNRGATDTLAVCFPVNLFKRQAGASRSLTEKLPHQTAVPSLRALIGDVRDPHPSRISSDPRFPARGTANGQSGAHSKWAFRVPSTPCAPPAPRPSPGPHGSRPTGGAPAGPGAPSRPGRALPPLSELKRPAPPTRPPRSKADALARAGGLRPESASYGSGRGRWRNVPPTAPVGGRKGRRDRPEGRRRRPRFDPADGE